MNVVSVYRRGGEGCKPWQMSGGGSWMRWNCNLSSVFSLTLLHSHTTNTGTINLRLRLSLPKNQSNWMLSISWTSGFLLSAQWWSLVFYLNVDPSPLTFTLCPHVNQLSSPKPSLLFTALPLPCIILHKLNGEGLATVYVGLFHIVYTCSVKWQSSSIFLCFIFLFFLPTAEQLDNHLQPTSTQGSYVNGSYSLW